MKSMLVGPEVSNLYVERLGQRVATSEQIGICCDGRLLIAQFDRVGKIIGLELM